MYVDCQRWNGMDKCILHNAKPPNITLIQVYGSTTAATEKELWVIKNIKLNWPDLMHFILDILSTADFRSKFGGEMLANTGSHWVLCVMQTSWNKPHGTA